MRAKGTALADYTAADGATAAALNRMKYGAIQVNPVVVVPRGGSTRLPHGLEAIEDSEGWLAQRFDACPGTVYLLRPDQHVCARWRRFDSNHIDAAVARATCNA